MASDRSVEQAAVAHTREGTVLPSIPGLTAEQMQRLLSLIEPMKPGYEQLLGKPTRIFDMGASYHMTENLSFLSKVEAIEPVPVELPDGVFCLAKLQGTMMLGSKLQLSEVLYIPHFHCNLVSIA